MSQRVPFFHSFSIKTRLMLLGIALSIIPMLVLSAIAIKVSYDSLNKLNHAAHEQGIEVLSKKMYAEITRLVEIDLSTAQSLKGNAIEDYFKVMIGRLQILQESPSVLADLREFTTAFHGVVDSIKNEDWERRRKVADVYYNNLVKVNQWYDVFLIDRKGWIVYTQCKEPDLGQSLSGDLLKNTAFGRCFAKLQANKECNFAIADYEPYAPSNGALAGFVMVPIRNAQGSLEGALAFQIGSDAINAIVNKRGAYLGKTGESYLVGRSPDGKAMMRSDRVIKKGKIGDAKFDELIDKALKGQSGVGQKTGSTGEKELVCYSPLELDGLNWAMITSISYQEAMAAAIEAEVLTKNVETTLKGISRTAMEYMLKMMGICILCALLLSALVSVWSASIMAKPLLKTAGTLKDISEGEGDLTSRLPQHEGEKDEMNQLARHFNVFISTINAIISDVQVKSKELEIASTKGGEIGEGLNKAALDLKKQASTSLAAVQRVSANLMDITASGDQISGMMSSVSAAVAEMAATTQEMSKQCSIGATQSRNANEKAQASGVVMDQLTEAAAKIGAVVNTIDDIADRTDLLALNATIEAASAGEAGKGFAVVAVEIKELSRQTQNATGEIATLIEGIRNSANQAASSSHEVSHIIELLSSTVEGIAAAVAEMAATAAEISNNVVSASKGSENIAQAIKGASADSQEVNKSVGAVSQLAQITEESANGSLGESKKLNSIAKSLTAQVKRFKV